MAESKIMKRWAVLTVLIYAFALLALTMPALMIAFGSWGNNPIKLQDEPGVFRTWGYWLWLVIMVAGQALLLLLPINIAERRPLKVPVIVTTFFLANLFFGGILSILCAVFKDDAIGAFGFLNPLPTNPPDKVADGFFWGMIVTIVAF